MISSFADDAAPVASKEVGLKDTHKTVKEILREETIVIKCG